MSKTKQANATSSGNNQMSDFELSMLAKNQFIMTTMNMSWQLAIAVLVPLIGGNYLDNKLGTGYAFFIAGFILAIALMALVVWRQIKLIKPIIPASKKGKV